MKQPKLNKRNYLRDTLKPILRSDMSPQDEWLFVLDAAKKHQVSHTSILNWIKESIANPETARVEARTLQLNKTSQPGAIVIRFL